LVRNQFNILSVSTNVLHLNFAGGSGFKRTINDKDALSRGPAVFPGGLRMNKPRRSGLIIFPVYDLPVPVFTHDKKKFPEKTGTGSSFIKNAGIRIRIQVRIHFMKHCFKVTFFLTIVYFLE
jgi:hypothetical protein